MDPKHCKGCDDDFYNGQNPYGVRECWNLKGAKVVTRYRTGLMDRPDTPGAFTEVRRPSCYRCKGFVFTSKPSPFAVDVGKE